jgi:hypothetical protein
MGRKCQHEGCKKRPAYNYDGQKPALYCNSHKLISMVDVSHKKCQHVGCITIPVYNYDGQKQALYCYDHKLPDMLDIRSKRCKQEGCKTRPSYNYEGQKQPLYCHNHKLADMLDIRSKRCEHEGCKKQPAYNYKGEKQGLYCAAHKFPEMLDVRSKICQHTECNKNAAYNFDGEKKPLYCNDHKQPKMIDVKNRKCQYEGCMTQAAYNYEGQIKALYCGAHKQPAMLDIKKRKCKSEWCSTCISNKAYEGYCAYCFMHLFPDKPISRNYKTKETAVVHFVKETFPDIDMQTDKRIQEGCSKRRPDVYIDLGYQVLIIEVDENQHIDYDCSCENKRIMELSQDIGHRPIVFIRFNPDDYEKNGTNITSCWSINKQGICCVKRTKQKEWKERLQALQNTVQYWLSPENQTHKCIEIIQLFYDQ